MRSKRSAAGSLEGATKRVRRATEVDPPGPVAWAPPGWVTARADTWAASTLGSQAVGVSVCDRTWRVAVASENGVVGIWRIVRRGEAGISLVPSQELCTPNRLLGVAWSPAGDGLLAVSGLGMVRVDEGRAPRVLWSTPDRSLRSAGLTHQPTWLGPSFVALACPGAGANWYEAATGKCVDDIRGDGRVQSATTPDGCVLAVGSDDSKFIVWSAEGGTLRAGGSVRHCGAVQRWTVEPAGSALWAADFDGRLSCFDLTGATPRKLDVNVPLPRPPPFKDVAGMRVMRLWACESDRPGEVTLHASTPHGYLRMACTRDGAVRGRRFTSYGVGDWVCHAGPPPAGEVVTSSGILDGSLARPRKPHCVPFDMFDAGAWGVALALRCGKGVQVWLRNPSTSVPPAPRDVVLPQE